MSIAAAPLPRLLVVEDDPELLSLVQFALEDSGYNITLATSLPQCRQMVEEQLFHLVITDLFRDSQQRSPLASIQPLIEQAAPTPIGVITGWQVPGDDPALSSLAFLLHKPFDLEGLLGKVDAALHPVIRSVRQSKLVEEFFLALNARDWPRLARLCLPEMLVAPPRVDASLGVGLSSYRAYLEERLSRLPGFTVGEAKMFSLQEGISARYLARWQGNDGSAHRAAGALHFRFRRGRIAEIEGVF